MGGQRCAGFFAQAGDHIEGTGGQARFQGQLSDAQGRQAGVFSRLEHGAIAHGQGGCNGAAEHLRRVVPRNDVGRHAQGFAQQAHLVAIEKGDGLAVHLVGRSAIELKVASQHFDVIARRGQGFASVFGFELRQFFFMVQDGLANAAQQTASIGGAHAAPRAVQRRTGGFDGEVDFNGCAARNLVECLAIAGVDHW